ncbi:MAG TPA: LysR family transcriptional regulator [Polyangiaceae bacterium]|nr:LysR family transcriptional regulator [Polyangiaceae bacterium]
MIRDELAGITVFLTVAEQRSFTRAAALLDVTPSAVSQTVTALEKRLGVRLLQRTTRSVGLTEAGERVVKRLRPAVAEVRATFEDVGRLRDRAAGTLRLTVPRVASRTVLEPLLAAFLASHPEVEVETRVDDGLSDVVSEGFDAGIRLGEALERDMVALRITGDERSAVVGSPAYFRVHGTPRHPRELHAHACIQWRQTTSGTLYRWEFSENGRDFETAVGGRVTTNDVDLMLRMALDGVGLAYLFESTVREELEKKRLVRVLGDFCPPFPGLYLYYPSRVHISAKLQAFVDFLKPRRPPRRSVSRVV